jgi:hypothetical protein
MNDFVGKHVTVDAEVLSTHLTSISPTLADTLGCLGCATIFFGFIGASVLWWLRKGRKA